MDSSAESPLFSRNAEGVASFVVCVAVISRYTAGKPLVPEPVSEVVKVLCGCAYWTIWGALFAATHGRSQCGTRRGARSNRQ